MKILIVSDRGDFNGAALRLVKDGHEVKIYYTNPASRVMMKGVIEQVVSLEEGSRWAPDSFLFDAPGQGKAAERLRQNGWKVIGGGQIQDDLELDKTFATKTMEAFGVRTPRTFAFPNLGDAGRFILTYKRRLVFKPSRPMPGVGSYVPESNDGLLNYLTQAKTVRKVDGPCILQDFVPGIQVLVQVWYAAGRPVAYPFGLIDEDGAFVSWAFPTREPRLVQKSLKKIGMLLEKKRYTGPLTVRGVVSKGKFYGLAFETGFVGIGSILPLFGEDFGGTLARIAGGDDKPIQNNGGFGCSVPVTLPPYPLCRDESGAAALYQASRGYYVEGVKADAWGRSVVPHDIEGKPGGICTAGFDGVPCEAIGSGSVVAEANAAAQESFGMIQVPKKQGDAREIARVAERRLNDLSWQNYDVPSAYPIPEQSATVVVAAAKPEQPKGVRNEKVPVPAHMATTTVSMPTKLG